MERRSATAGGPRNLIQSSFFLDRSFLAIPFMCNVHPWMRAFVFVFAHPYFEVTSKAGEFELKGLPPGTYTIESWHEKYGTQDQSVTIGPQETKASVAFDFDTMVGSRRRRGVAQTTEVFLLLLFARYKPFLSCLLYIVPNWVNAR